MAYLTAKYRDSAGNPGWVELYHLHNPQFGGACLKTEEVSGKFFLTTVSETALAGWQEGIQPTKTYATFPNVLFQNKWKKKWRETG